jgi:hypothetical protein
MSEAHQDQSDEDLSDALRGKLRRVAVADMERVIAEALKSLTGEDYDAEIGQIEFTEFGRGAEMRLKINRHLKWSSEK